MPIRLSLVLLAVLVSFSSANAIERAGTVELNLTRGQIECETIYSDAHPETLLKKAIAEFASPKLVQGFPWLEGAALESVYASITCPSLVNQIDAQIENFDERQNLVKARIFVEEKVKEFVKPSHSPDLVRCVTKTTTTLKVVFPQIKIQLSNKEKSLNFKAKKMERTERYGECG